MIIDDWHTPKVYTDAAREVMGEIDLDPASSDVAQISVRSSRYFTAKDDGLDRPWSGRVWLNPPYSRGILAAFVSKLLQDLGDVSEAIVLVNNATDARWFHDLLSACHALCLPPGRIRFESPNGSPHPPRNGQVFFYYGWQPARFARVFRRFGPVFCRMANFS